MSQHAAPPAPPTSDPPTRLTAVKVANLAREGMILAVLAILIIIFGALAPNFLTVNNLLQVVLQTSVTAILAAGMTFVILTAGIDLSVGSALGVCAMVAVVLSVSGAPGWMALIAGVAAGALIGLSNGLMVAVLRLPAFIVTLAALNYLRGIVYVGTDGTTIVVPDLDYAWLGQGSFLSVPVPVYVLIVVYVAAWILLNRTVFGRHVLSVGGNPEAARLAGINVKRTLVMVYVIAGVCVGIAALIESARLQSAVPNLGTGYELNAIAAVVLGGTSLFGGRGSLIGTLIGALIIGVLTNGMTLMNVPSFYQLIVQGIVVILAILADKIQLRSLVSLLRRGERA